VHGAMADVYRDQIAYRTRRGLEGRARHGKPTGGRAYGYIAARDNVSGQREIHPEQAETVRRIFAWYAAGKSPRWIAGELNRLEVPSPGASWNRTSVRLHAKRKHGWVSTAIHGDHTRGTGILNNRLYVGQVVWNRSTWKRSAADSKQRRWQLNDAAQMVTHQEDRLRIVPQPLWDAVKARQQAVEGMTVKLRGALRRGRLPRHLLSGLLTCQQCGGAFRCVNGREYGCASHRDGGEAGCANGVRVPIALAESKLLDRLVEEMLSPEGVALLERRIREHARNASRAPRVAPKPQAAQVAKRRAEIDQLRALMKAGTLSQAVAQSAIETAEGEIRGIERMQPAKEEKDTARIIRMLPRAAAVLRERISGGNLGLRDPRSIVQGRNTLFAMFGGKVPLRPAQVKRGEKPYLIARVGLNRSVLLQAAGFCVESGSGGMLCDSLHPLGTRVRLL
jgi:site-specific DNA recombinase